MIKFTKKNLEQAVIKLFEAEGYKHLIGDYIQKEMTDVLLRDGLKQYLLNRYCSEDITLNEIASIIRKLELYPSSALYESNKEISKLIADGEVDDDLEYNFRFLTPQEPQKKDEDNFWFAVGGKV